LAKKSKKIKMDSSDSEFEPESVNKEEEEEEEEEASENDSKKSMSDQNSSDEEVVKKKRGLKKKKATSDSEDQELDELEKDRIKIKRKRIKKMASSDEENPNDDDNGDEDDEEGDKKKASGRKTIRKILRTDKLDVSTKEAAKIEKERKQRIEDRQKMYNQFYDERPEEAKEISKLVLDFDEETKEPLLQVDKKLCKKLKPHQANGVKFMWDACFESIERAQSEPGSGCILAHCMVISFFSLKKS
jgi:transcriptional regulator ATRX